MAISGSTAASNTSVDATAAAAAMKKSIGLNKDDFLKLFISELKYQDPLKPQDPSSMLNQLSQLSLVEQSYNSNTALTNLLTAQNNSATLNSVSFIGKTITANGNAIPFDGASPAQLNFAFDLPVTAGTVTVRDASGSVVKSMPLAQTQAGSNGLLWDGRDANGTLLPAGAYSFSVSGTLANGNSLAATTYTTGKVDGVSLANGTALLTIGKTAIAVADIVKVQGV